MERTFDESNPKSQLSDGTGRWPFILGNHEGNNAQGVQVLHEGDSLGCGDVVAGDQDGCGSTWATCKGCMSVSYSDNARVQPGQTIAYNVKGKPGGMSWDLSEDLCGLFVELKYLDNPVV